MKISTIKEVDEDGDGTGADMSQTQNGDLNTSFSDSNLVRKKTSMLRLVDHDVALPDSHSVSKMVGLSEDRKEREEIVRQRRKSSKLLEGQVGLGRKISSFKTSVPTYLMNDVMDTTPQELDEDTELHVKRKGITCMLLTTVAAISLSSFQYGWAIGVVNAPQKIVTAWYNESYTARYGVPMSESHQTLLWAITVSIYNISGLIGGLSAGYLCDRFGRKRVLLVNNSITFVAAIIFLTAKTASSFEMVIVARFLIGFNCGISSSTVAMYLAEIAPVNIRGAMCSAHQVALSLAILMSQVIGLHQILGTPDGWPILFALAVVPAIIQLIMLPFLPESPRYILIYKEKEKSAKRALIRLRNSDDVEDEIEQMKVEYEDQKNLPKVTWADMVTKSVYRKPLIIASETHMSQQLSGISAVMSYSTSLFLKAGLPDINARYATIGMGVLYFLLCTLSSMIVEKAGRRTLYLTGLAGMWFSSIFLTVTLVLGDEPRYFWAAYLSIIFVFSYVGFCAIGPSVIAWFIASELFTQSARAKGCSMSVCFNWGSSFVIVLLFPILLVTLNNYTFLVFTVLLALFWLYTYYFLPETQGRTSDELSRLFMTPSDKTKIYNFWKHRRLFRPKRDYPHTHNHYHHTKF